MYIKVCPSRYLRFLSLCDVPVRVVREPGRIKGEAALVRRPKSTLSNVFALVPWQWRLMELGKRVDAVLADVRTTLAAAPSSTVFVGFVSDNFLRATGRRVFIPP